MAILERFTKQPNDNLKYTIDYRDWLPTGVSVASCVVSDVSVINSSESDVGEPTLTASVPVVVGGNLATFFAASGTDGKNYKVTFLATMSDTQLLESEIEFRVTDT